MDLKEFVTETLVQIVQGVKDAQTKVSSNSSSSHISPQLSTAIGVLERQGRLVAQNGGLVHLVDFDVALTVTEGTGSKGGVGIFVGAIGLGAQNESKASNSSISRIKFQVPITLE